MTNKITVNGVEFTGNNIVISNGRVMIDGKFADKPTDREVSIIVNGDIETIKADACNMILIQGQCKGSISTASGDVECGEVGGSINTMSGDVNALDVKGNVTTMSGDISHTKPE